MKNFLSMLIIISISQVNFTEFNDYKAQYSPPSLATATTTSCSSCCPLVNSDGSTSIVMPQFIISVLGVDGITPVGPAFQFVPNASFTRTNAILNVHIFPPSTGIGTNSYFIIYTLKSLAGDVIQKEYIPALSTSGKIASSAINSATSVPGKIAIYPAAIAATASTPLPSFLPSTLLASSRFLPSGLTTVSQALRIQALNGISPISQKFLLTQNGSQLTITPLSGMLEGDYSSAAGTNSIAIQPATPTSSTPSSSIDILVNDSANSQSTAQFTFTGKSFNATDLASGLSLTLNIFPPSVPAVSGNYIMIATLKTLDGLKLRKQIAVSGSTTFPIFNYPPSSVAISSTGNTILTSSFFNATASATNFAMLSPISLKYLLQQPIGGPLNVLLL